MKYKLSDIIHIPKLQKLLEGFCEITGISAVSVIDVEGNVLVKVKWEEACANYHRKSFETEKKCLLSDINIVNDLNIEKGYVYIKCPHGLIDAAAPIVIDGHHLANVFYGQFLFEKPDLEFFRNQARKYGFNEQDYLEKIKKIPVISKEKFKHIMNHFVQLAEMVGNLGLNNLKLMETQEYLLQENEEKIKKMIENAPYLSIGIYDREGKVLYINKAGENLFGWKKSELIGRNIRELKKDKESMEIILTAINIADENNEAVGPKELVFHNKNGSKKNIITTLFPIQYVNRKEFICMSIDITKQRMLEQEMKRIDKLNLLGEMAANMAHEIRNPMTTVQGFLQVLGEKEEYLKYKECFDLMLKELAKANSIITEVLLMDKNKERKVKIQNINYVIKKITHLIEINIMANNQHLQLELEEVEDFVMDEQEIRRLILNLVYNSIESMDREDVLTIKTYQKNRTVFLLVKDMGKGIDKDLKSSLGIPFFNEEKNKLALGLAVVYSIADRHNANIQVNSSNKGTSFLVSFNLENSI